MDESERRFFDADNKVVKYMLSRIKTVQRSLQFLKVAKTSKNMDLEYLQSKHLDDLIHCMDELYSCWSTQEDKKNISNEHPTY